MSIVPDNRELLEMARRWAAANYPGYSLEVLALQLHGLQEKVKLVVPPCECPRPGSPMIGTETQEEDGQAGAQRSRCSDDILTVLKAVGHNLTTTRILSELNDRKMYWSDRTVSGCLARMVEDGTLHNERSKKPRGYGLPEWEES